VAGRVVFGDKAGWINVIDAADGKLITDLKIGDNVNSTPAILDGRIYVGAFNGQLYCLDMEPKTSNVGSQTSDVGKKPDIRHQKSDVKTQR
jgi:outer membrane protein assembly factor BamB